MEDALLLLFAVLWWSAANRRGLGSKKGIFDESDL
jgi:hypothetical protein